MPGQRLGQHPAADPALGRSFGLEPAPWAPANLSHSVISGFLPSTLKLRNCEHTRDLGTLGEGSSEALLTVASCRGW